MRRKKLEEQGAASEASVQTPRLTPIDVQQKEFRLAFRGYNERDVDAFLDQVTEELALYIEENRRLRGAEGGAARVEGPPAGAAGAAGAPGAVPSMPGDHSAVVPFLNREREFLQSLAGLVQDHAESVKAMVKAQRERTASTAPASGPSSSVISVPDSVAPAAGPREETSAAAGSPIAAVAAEAAVEAPEMAAQASGAAEDGPGQPARSLRELFWGED